MDWIWPQTAEFLTNVTLYDKTRSLLTTTSKPGTLLVQKPLLWSKLCPASAQRQQDDLVMQYFMLCYPILSWCWHKPHLLAWPAMPGLYTSYNQWTILLKLPHLFQYACSQPCNRWEQVWMLNMPLWISHLAECECSLSSDFNVTCNADTSPVVYKPDCSNPQRSRWCARWWRCLEECGSNWRYFYTFYDLIASAQVS